MIEGLYDVFQHWAKKGSVFIMSDPHFNDEESKKYAGWPTPDEQVKLINSIAHKNDTLILLGDIGDVSYVKQLKAGYKVLIMGNHDEGHTKFERRKWVERSSRDLTNAEFRELYPDCTEIDRTNELLNPDWPKDRVVKDVHCDNRLFDEVYEGPLFIAKKILLSHEHIPGMVYCVNIHGHDHAAKNVFYVDPNGAKSVNVAANVCGFRPINLKDEIKKGLLSNVADIHRITIDHATKRARKKNSIK